MDEKYIKLEIEARLNETFIVQLFFGILMVVVPIIMMIAVYGFDFNLLFSIISGALLIFYAFRVYNVRLNLMNLAEKSDKDLNNIMKARVNETFIVQLIFGILMVVVPIILMIAMYGFDYNLLFSVISGGLLIFYAFRYYRTNMNKILDKLE